MKIVRSSGVSSVVYTPLFGGVTVRFDNHRAAVSDEIADYLVGIDGAAFSIEKAFLGDDSDSVLVIRDMGLGDVLLATPLCRKLREGGKRRVGFVTLERYRCLFDGNPNVCETHALESYPGGSLGYDAVLDIRMFVEHRESTGLHMNRADAFCAIADLSISPEERRIDYFVKPEEVDGARRSLSSALESAKPVCAFVLRSSTDNRNLSTDRINASVSALVGAGFHVALLDHERFSPSENDDVTDLTGKLSIRMAAAAMSICDVVVCPDTGLFHMAQALGKPTITYFGPFPLAERETRRGSVDIAVNSCCRPCRQYFCLARDADRTPKCLCFDPSDLASQALRAIEK